MNATDPPVELTAPDIEPYRHGNAGAAFAHTYESGRPGPHVLINALMHGNELAGAIALDALHRRIRPRRGRLTLVFANVAAYACFDPHRPGASRYIDEDMNRVWDDAVLDGPRRSVELDRARELRPLYAQADLLLDLHSMQLPGPPLLLCGRAGRARRLARDLAWPDWVVADAGHAAGPRLIDHAAFTAPGSPGTTVLLECGQHWARDTARVALEGSLRFLLLHGLVDPAEAGIDPGPEPGPRRLVEITHAVTAETDAFVWVREYGALERIAAPGTLLGRDGGKPLTTPYADCVLVMPARHPRPGQTAVRLGRVAGAP